MRPVARPILALSIVLVCGGTARGLINPNFTPEHLVREAELILVLELKPADDRGRISSTVQRCLKGQPPAKGPEMNLASALTAEHLKQARELIARAPKRPAVFLRGKGEKDESISFLHVQGRWLALQRGKQDVWDFEKIDDSTMPAVWAGGTDMLVRIMDRLLSRPGTVVPVVAGCSWAEGQHKLGTAAGEVRAAAAVDLAGDGRLALHIASDGGDRLYRYDPNAKEFQDLTDKLGLAARSRTAAWGDFDGDGRLDLASWDGKSLSLWQQGADGRFAARKVEAAPAGDCQGLAALGGAGWDLPGLLWSGPKGPILLAPAAGGGFKPAEPLDLGGAGVKELGQGGSCLTADLDGDALPDILWVCEKRSLLWKGTAAGGFQKPLLCAVAQGAGRGGAFLGDFDADGLLDVLAVAQQSCLVWQNRGGGRFEETFSQSGEIEHVYEGGGLGGNACDFNNDGVPDAFLASATARPLMFFNRGFRSFGHAHSLDMVENQRLPESHQGQQAGVVADLDGDGAQDIALVAKDGGIWVIRREQDEPPLAARAALAGGKGFPGPLTVTGWEGNTCLGAWNVTAGAAEAFFGRPKKGPITLKWRLPGGQEQSRTVVVLRPTRVILNAAR